MLLFAFVLIGASITNTCAADSAVETQFKLPCYEKVKETGGQCTKVLGSCESAEKDITKFLEEFAKLKADYLYKHKRRLLTSIQESDFLKLDSEKKSELAPLIDGPT